MKSTSWKKKIVSACQEAGTYRPFFDPVIETLATILERRDDAQKAFADSGGKTIVQHTNKWGATNSEQNPILRLINDLNRDALAYWKELGLTPKGLRQINEKALEKKKGGLLIEVLKDFGGEEV